MLRDPIEYCRAMAVLTIAGRFALRFGDLLLRLHALSTTLALSTACVECQASKTSACNTFAFRSTR